MTDGGPTCLLCRFHRQECTFYEDPQPRKRRAIATDDGGSATTRRRSTPISETLIGIGLSPQDTPKIRQDLPIENYANLRGPSLLKRTLGLQSHVHSRLIGSTSVYEPLLLEIDQGQASKDSVPTLRKVDSDDTTFVLFPDAETQDHESDIPDLDAIETVVAPYGQALIHLYFRIVHPSFPILHKKVYLEKYERTHREFSPPLLAAVYLLALNWWSYSSELSMLPKPDVSNLETLALKTMARIVHRPKLSTIQAGLLLLQRPGGDSWALTSQLVGLGQDMGLHLDCTDWRIPSWERGLRKRLAWAIFSQDKWGALVHGRPSHITPTDWEAQPLQEDDFPENAKDEDDEDGSAEVEKGRVLFCEMVRLSDILAQILSSFYTLKAERDLTTRAHEGVRWILEIAKPLQLALRQWYSNLPATLKMENIAARKLSSTGTSFLIRVDLRRIADLDTGYLHLGYYAVEITLHRRIIRSLSSVDEANLRSICRQAAQIRLHSAMEFIQNLRPEHLQSFWYSASKYNFALVGTFISLLWVTATEKEEADMYRVKLDEYRWMLRLSSKSADFLEQALSMLATSTGALVKAIPSKPDPERILSRYQSRASQKMATTRPSYSEHSSQVSSVVYRSEPELQEDTSPENIMGETPSESGVVGGEWTVDNTWLNTLHEASDSFVPLDRAYQSNAYIGLANDQTGINFDHE